MEKPFLSSNYMKKMKSPTKAASIRVNRGKMNNKFPGFGNAPSPQTRPFARSSVGETSKRGNKLVVYNLRVKVKKVAGQADKAEQLVYDFKVSVR